jgi:hypothetical protein
MDVGSPMASGCSFGKYPHPAGTAIKWTSRIIEITDGLIQHHFIS